MNTAEVLFDRRDNDTINEFMQAAKVLQQDPRFIAVHKARKANDENEALQQRIKDFNDARQKLNEELAKSERDPVALSLLNEEINTLYGDIMEDKTMVEYNAAKDDMADLINYINAIIAASVDGQDPMQVQPPQPENCGEGGCDGCAGCG